MNTDYYEMLMLLQQETQAWIRSNALRKNLHQDSCDADEGAKSSRVEFDTSFLVNASTETK